MVGFKDGLIVGCLSQAFLNYPKKQLVFSFGA